MAMLNQHWQDLQKERLAELRELKRTGKKKILGYFCLYAPVELIRATGAIPVRLADADYQAELRGEQLLRSDACPFCKSCLGHLLADQSELYQLIDGLVSVNTCDMMRRLPEVVERNRPLPIFYLYLPRTAEPFPERIEQFEEELSHFRTELLAFTGDTGNEEKLRAEINRMNRLRQLLQELDRRRPAISGSELFDLVALATLLEPEQTAALITELLGKLKDQPRGKRPRLLLAGSILAQGDRLVLELIEERADIVADVICTGSRWFAGEIDPGTDPLRATARFYFTRLPCACRRPNRPLYETLRRLIAERRIQGVVYKTLLYCDPWRFEAKHLRRELAVPLLEIDGDYSRENRGQLRTRIEAFLETLR